MSWAPDGDHTLGRIPLSALEHYAYCPRQAAIIHLEGIFTDDPRTTLGTDAHRNVHTPRRPLPPPATGYRRLTAVPVWSDSLGLYGVCDVIEISADGDAVPIEHKVGRYQAGGPADLQVVAQAVCLSEMLDQQVPHGVIYSHTDRRRHVVALTDEVLSRVRTVAAHVHALLTNEALPPPAADRRCRGCSLQHDCLPRLRSNPSSADLLFAPQPLGDWDG